MSRWKLIVSILDDASNTLLTVNYFLYALFSSKVYGVANIDRGYWFVFVDGVYQVRLLCS